MAHGIVTSGFSYPDGTIETGTGLFGSGVERIVSADAYAEYAVITKDKELVLWNGDTYSNAATGWNGVERRGPWMMTFPKRTGWIADAEIKGGLGWALWSDGTFYTWGNNDYGVCGTGNTSRVGFPYGAATGVTKVFKQIGYCYHQSQNLRYIQKSDGKIYASGYGASGMFGDGTTANKTTYTYIAGPSNRFDASVSNNTVRDLWIIGGARYGAVFLQLNDGTIWTCGYNNAGRLGNGNETQQNTWVDVTTAWGGTGPGNILDMTGGSGYYDSADSAACNTVMLRADGSVRTAGNNGWGSIGKGSIGGAAQSTPYVTIASGIKEIASNTCGPLSVYALSNTTLYSWGYNDYGNLGVGSTTTAAAGGIVQSYTTGITSTASLLLKSHGGETYPYRSSMFVKRSSTPSATNIISTGHNAYGDLGKGITGDGTAVTSKSIGPINTYSWGAGDYYPDFVQITQSGRDNGRGFLGLDSKGRLYQWGYNGRYDIGIYWNTTHPDVPIRILDI